MSTRTRTRNAFESQLNGSITDSATSFDLDSATGLVHPCYLVIDPDSLTEREYIRVGSITGNTLNSVTRNLTGSAGGAVAHASGTPVRAAFVQQMLDDIFTDIEALEAEDSTLDGRLTTAEADIDGLETDVTSLQSADTAHFGGTDTSDHPEATTSVRGFMSAADKTKLDAYHHGAMNGLTDDDHSIYLKEKASGGLASEVPEHDHTVAAEGGLIGSMLDIQIYDEANDVGTLSTSMQDVASFTWNKPTGWTSYDLLIMGFGYYENAGSTRNIWSRVKADSNEGTLVTQFGGFGANGNTNTGPLTQRPIAKFSGLSDASLTVAMEAQLVGGGGNAGFRAGNLVVFATRVT